MNTLTEHIFCTTCSKSCIIILLIKIFFSTVPNTYIFNEFILGVLLSQDWYVIPKFVDNVAFLSN